MWYCMMYYTKRLQLCSDLSHGPIYSSFKSRYLFYNISSEDDLEDSNNIYERVIAW